MLEGDDAASMRLRKSAPRSRHESNAAVREIADIEAEIRAGHTDLQGLCLALSDWSAELRILQNEQSRRPGTRRRDVIGGS